MQRIIVGFDGSPFAIAALRWSVAEAHRHGAELTALAVLDEQPPPIPDSTSQPPIDTQPTVLDELRDAVAATAEGFPVTFRYTLGEAAAELVAASRDADLLVLGSRGRGRFTDALLGSVSRAALHRAACPIVVIRPDLSRQPDGRVVVGIDGSELSTQALQIAATEARLRGAELHAVHAVRWDRIGTELLTPTDEQLVAWGRELTDDQLKRAGVDAQRIVVPGHAGDVLVEYSRTADLLVLGSWGRNPLAGLLLGSTSDYCAHHATCPVMIVRPPAEGAASS